MPVSPKLGVRLTTSTSIRQATLTMVVLGQEPPQAQAALGDIMLPTAIGTVDFRAVSAAILVPATMFQPAKS